VTVPATRSRHRGQDVGALVTRLRGGDRRALARLITLVEDGAVEELRRVAGTQLDAEFVEIFVHVLAGKDVRYRHGEDADFDAELGLGKRVQEYSQPVERRASRGGPQEAQQRGRRRDDAPAAEKVTA
jgi:hypothetical protein